MSQLVPMPWEKAYFPVKTEALVGEQRGAVAYAFLNLKLFSASLSRLGVLHISLPLNPKASNLA
jgi:hypothetical protein